MPLVHIWKMPPKSGRGSVVSIKPEDLILVCEWKDCTEVFSCMNTFTQHVAVHLMQHLEHTTEPGAVSETGIGPYLFHCFFVEAFKSVKFQSYFRCVA